MRMGLVFLFLGCLVMSGGCKKKDTAADNEAKPPVVQDMNIQKPESK